jgi:hypothetical protein
LTGTTERSEFWARLARRANAVLPASRDNSIRFLWIDDIMEPTSLVQQGETSAVTFAYVSEDDGRSFVEYQTNVRISERAATAYRAGDCNGLLPEPGTDHWFTIDRTGKQLTIDIG